MDHDAGKKTTGQARVGTGKEENQDRTRMARQMLCDDLSLSKGTPRMAGSN